MKDTQPEAASNDFVGYEALIDFMKERALYKLEGDIVEIGAFMGGGTAKLARFARQYGKKVYAIDIFDIEYDRTMERGGARMCDIYRAFLQNRSQRDVYLEATRGLNNIITIDKDSKEVEFPEGQAFMFGFIDGNHQPEYVRNDFHVIWPHLVPGGVLGLHDYNFDLPEVTRTIDKLVEEYRGQIEGICELQERHIILLTRRGRTPAGRDV